MFAFLPEISFFDWKSSVCLQDGSQSCGTTEESGEGDGRQEEGRQGTAPSQEEENQVQPIWNNDSFEKLNARPFKVFFFRTSVHFYRPKTYKQVRQPKWVQFSLDYNKWNHMILSKFS